MQLKIKKFYFIIKIVLKEKIMENNQITIQPEESYKIIRKSVLTAQSKVYSAVNSAMVQAYWEIGQEIHNCCKFKIYETILSSFSNSPHTV